MSDALWIVDMVNDFVTGKLGTPRAKRIIPNIRTLAGAARDAGVPVIYVNDAHLPKDFELKIWGPHSMAGTQGGQILPALAAPESAHPLREATYRPCFQKHAPSRARRRPDRQLQ